MPVLQRRNITQTSKTIGMPVRLCTQAKSCVGAELPSVSLYLPVLIKKIPKNHTGPREKQSWYQILSLQSFPTGKLFQFLMTEKRPFQFPVQPYLQLFYPHFVLAPPITSIFIFLFQLCILMLELLHPTSISLRGTESRTSGTVAVLIMPERIYQTVSLFQSDILLLALHQIT